MAKVTEEIEVPINFLKVSFEGELVDKAEEEGDFYYKITAHVSEEQSFEFWEKGLVSRVKRRELGKKIFKEIMKELKQDLANKKIKGSK